MEEQNEQPNQEERVIKDKEAQRVFPSLLKVDLDEFGLKDREVMSGGELFSESESGPVVARRKFKRASEYLNLSPLVLAPLLKIFYKIVLVEFF